MKKRLMLFVALLVGFGFVFSSCVTTDTQIVKPNNSNFVAPKAVGRLWFCFFFLCND